MSARPATIATRVLWYALALYSGLAYAVERILPFGITGWSPRVVLAREIAGLIVILSLFVVADLGVGRAIRVMRDRKPADDTAFPAGVTVVVGTWLGIFSILAIAGLLYTLAVENLQPSMKGALVAMTAAGIGSAVATIVGYLRHASEVKDFELAFVPWYFARPLMGMLLGLIFFLLLKAGLLATYPQVATENAAVNEWGIAGIGALVGLFSKPAIDKLREVFSVLFRTEEERDEELLRRLPEDERERVRPFLPSPAAGEKVRK